MKIKDVMTEHVSVATPDSPLIELASRMRDEDIGSVPIVQNDKLIGMVTDRDIVIRAVADGREPKMTTAREIMSPALLYCYDDQTIDEVLGNMGEQQVRRLPVVNRNKRLVGFVSLGDLSKSAQERKAGEALREISQPGPH